MKLNLKKVGFAIGDKVEIVDTGKLYDTYSEFALKAKAFNWKSGVQVRNGEQGIVTYTDFHEHYSTYQLYIVKIGDKEVIMGFDGLKLIRRGSKKVDKVKPVKFLIKYKNGGTQVDGVSTLSEVKKRVEQLIRVDHDIKDTILVYEINKIHKVEFDVKITGL